MINRLDHLLGLYTASPGDAFVLFALAKEHEKLGDHEKALSFYLQLKQAHPTYVGLYYHLGKLYEMLQQPEAALDIYQTGIEVARAAGDAHAASELGGAKLNLEYE
jgi:tetratricopeptide (TPR) repeat protein